MENRSHALQERYFEPLLAAVRKNCLITDAVHAGDYTLCVYLLKMREYFRWEKGYGFADVLPHAEVGSWLKEREQLWETLEHESYTALPVDGVEHDPFDTEALNRSLNPHGLVYSAGLGHNGRAHFFLARLEQRQQHDDFSLLISADEFARDLTAPPAMTLGKTVFVRRESLRRMIWEKIEEWRWNSLDNPMGRAIHCYPFDSDIDNALAAMTDDQVDTLVLHEIGEVAAGNILGAGWEDMLATLPHSRIELSLRAIRDNFADSLSTLPALVESAQPAQLHFFMATLTNLRKSLAPSLLGAYETWLKTGSLEALEGYIPKAQDHWRDLTERVLRMHVEGASLETLQNLIDTQTL